MNRMDGTVAVVSGAAGGIGAATAALLRAEGARVAGLDLTAGDAAELDLACDLTDDAALRDAAIAIERALGPVTVVVHAAAVSEHATTLASSPAAFARIHDVNVGGAVRLVQTFAPAMIAARRGAFVFVSSINGRFGAPGLSAYAASKGALDTLTRTLALELAEHGVRVNAVSPASIDTPLLRSSFERLPDPDEARRRNVARHPLGRLGAPEDVARLILFLASGEAGWITGANYAVDGGAGVARR